MLIYYIYFNSYLSLEMCIFMCIYVYAYIRIQLANFCGCLLCPMISYFISLTLNASSAWEAPKDTRAHYNKYFI